MRCCRQRPMRGQNSVSEIRNQRGKIPITPTGRDRADRPDRGFIPLYNAPATRAASAARTCTDSVSSPAPAGRLPPASCFGVCLVRQRRELCVRWKAIGNKDEDAVLCVNFVTSYPVPRSTRRTGVFIDFRQATPAKHTARRATKPAKPVSY
jgi:hypothetical protein